MRKYQQLLLVVISCISVGVLFMYKTENRRLKDVLQVINFFGRDDTATLRRACNSSLTSSYVSDFVRPLPVWQLIGDSFHAYAAYWKRNELVTGGEVLALVVGRPGAVINFGCSVVYDGGNRLIQGKFSFQRIDKDGEDTDGEFTRYRFKCHVSRDFGQPESVTFNDRSSTRKTAYKLRVRHLKQLRDISLRSSLQRLTICLELVTLDPINQTLSIQRESELLQFFLHHYALGVEDYIVYNGDDLSTQVLQYLRHLNIRLYLLPFNFPFPYLHSVERLRHIIEIDCIMRNTNRARNTLLLSSNEFIYLNTKVEDEKSVLRSLQHYAEEVTRFEMPTFSVCIDQNHKLLSHNTLYDPEIRSPHRIFLFRLHSTSNTIKDDTTPHSVALPLSMVFAHRYVNCVHVGKDGLHDWRNSLREDFMQHIQRLSNEVKALL